MSNKKKNKKKSFKDKKEAEKPHEFLRFLKDRIKDSPGCDFLLFAGRYLIPYDNISYIEARNDGSTEVFLRSSTTTIKGMFR